MKVKDKTKQSAKFKLFGTFATAGMIAFSALSLGVLPNTIPHNVFADQVSPFVVTEISNAGFDSTNTSTFPKTASSWEKLNASSGIINGVISSTEADFKNYYKQYGLFYAEGNVLNESDEHSQAYLMNALNKTAKFGLESSEFSLDANSYYAIRVDVKTGLDCLISDEKKTIESFASIYLKLGDKIVASKPYIITNNAWSTYYFFVQTSFEDSSKAKVQLYLGSKEADSSGAVLFDNLICTKYSKSLYDSTFGNISNNKKATPIGNNSVYEYISDTSLNNVDYANRVEVTNSLFADSEFGNESLWEKETYGNSSAIKSGFIDLSLGYNAGTTMIPASPKTNQIASESKMLFMNVLENNETQGASVCYTSKAFTLKRFGNYLIQFYVKTSSLTGSGLHASVVPTNEDYSAIKVSSITSSSSPITNDWSVCQIYVQSSSYEDVEVKLEFGIGSVKEKSTATGYAFIDDLRAFEIGYDQYAKASASGNIGKGEFSKSVTNNSKISNANFDKVSDTAGISAPFAPAEWTAVNESNKESGIINNQYIGFNPANAYGNISWETVGLTSAQSFIDVNSKEEFADLNNNGKYDEDTETYTDANGNGKFDGELYVANQNLLMLNTLKNNYQAYQSKSIELTASTLYKLSVDAKALVEGAYIKVTYGDNILDYIEINPSASFKTQELVFITPKATANIQIELGLGTKENPAIGYAFFDAIMLTDLKDSSDSDYTPKGELDKLIKENATLNYVDLENNFFNEIPNSQTIQGLYSAQSWKDESESGVNAGIKIENDQKSLLIASEKSNTSHKLTSNFKYTLDSSKYYKVSFKLKTSKFENLVNSGATFGFEEKNEIAKIFSNIIAEEEKTFEFFLKAGEVGEITPFITLNTQNSAVQEYAELIDFKIEEISETDFTVKENEIKTNENEDYSNIILIGATTESGENQENQENADTPINFEPSAWSWILPTLITCLAIILAFIAIIIKNVKGKVGKRGKKYKNEYDRTITIHKAILDKEVEELRAKKLEEAKASLLATQEKLRLLEDSYKEKTKNDDVNKEAEYKKLVRNRRKHANKEQKLKEEIEYLESDEFKEDALNEVLANREEQMKEFVADNQLEKFEETEIVVDENLNEIDSNENENFESSNLEDVHEIVVDENAEKEAKENQENEDDSDSINTNENSDKKKN